MRRVVYHTIRGNRTPHLEDALIVGIDRMELIDIPEKMALPENREKAREVIRNGVEK